MNESLIQPEHLNVLVQKLQVSSFTSETISLFFSLIEFIDKNPEKLDYLDVEQLGWVCYNFLHDNDQDVVSAAIRCLWMINDRSMVGLFIPDLRDPNTNQRIVYNIIKLIGQLKELDLTPYIIDILGFSQLADAVRALIFNVLRELNILHESVLNQCLDLLKQAEKAVNLEKSIWVSAFLYVERFYQNTSTHPLVTDYFQHQYPNLKVTELKLLHQLSFNRQEPILHLDRIIASRHHELDEFIKTPSTWLQEHILNEITPNDSSHHRFKQYKQLLGKMVLVREIQPSLFESHLFKVIDFLVKRNSKNATELGVSLSLYFNFNSFKPLVLTYLQQLPESIPQTIHKAFIHNTWKEIVDATVSLCKRQKDDESLVSLLRCLNQKIPSLSENRISKIKDELSTFIGSIFTQYNHHLVLNLEATRFLVLTKSDNSAQLIISKLQSVSDMEDFHKGTLLFWLGHYQEPQAIAHLTHYLNDKNHFLLKYAVEGLLANSSSETSLILINVIKQDKIPNSIKVHIAESLDINLLPAEIDFFQTFDLKSCHVELRESLFELRERFEQGKSIEISDNVMAGLSTENTLDIEKIDIEIKKRLSEFSSLSSAVQRALRTSEVFYRNLDIWYQNGIDLSPIVNLQSKAIELLFKDFFDPFTEAVINNRSVQKKLDLLGYSRGHKAQLGQLENYLSNLPYIRDISYFSANKLKKMLIALAAYDGDRKFLLDGIKAYALFFLTFGRSTCPHGLSGIMNTGVENDHELFQFVQKVHWMQDMRNRLTHETMHAVFDSDIKKFREKTYDVLNIMMKMYHNLQERK